MLTGDIIDAKKAASIDLVNKVVPHDKLMLEARVLAENAQGVADFKRGKEQVLKFLVGQVMKATKGQANPQVVNELFRNKLGEGQPVA